MLRCTLRRDAVDVAGEHGALLDVGDTEETSGDTLESDGEATVRRHAVFEGIEVEMECIGVHAATEHLLAIVRLLMDTLATGGDLQTTHEEVEAESQRRILGVIHGVESTVLGGEMGDEDEVGPVFLEGVPADSAFLLGCEVILASVVRLAEVVLEENLMHLAEFPRGHLLGQDRINGIEEVELVRTVALHDGDDMAQQGCLQRHDILLTFDEAHLHIEGDILIEVAGGSMFLRAVGGRNLEDALIDADADLLVELRRLGEINLLAEIIHLEDVGTAFCTLGYDLRGEDLGEAVGSEELAERACDGGLHLEDRHVARVTESDLTVIELIAEECLLVAELEGVHIDHLGGCRAAQDAHLCHRNLDGVVESSGVLDPRLVDGTGEGNRHLAAEVV